MNYTPIRIEGQIYLREQNPYPEWYDLEQPNALFADFEIDHPPIIALFKCQKGQTFVEGVDIRKVWQWKHPFDREVKDWKTETNEDEFHTHEYSYSQGYETRPAFELIKSERGEAKILQDAKDVADIPDEAKVTKLEDMFRNFIRQEHLTATWDKFFENYPDAIKITEASRLIPVNCYHTECPNCGHAIDVIPGKDTFIEHPLPPLTANVEKAQKDKIIELGKLTEPIKNWLGENYHPHVVLIITSSNIELLEGLINISNGKS